MFSKYTDTHGCLGTRSLHRNDCLRFEGESGRDARVGAGRKGWGRGGGRIARVHRARFCSAVLLRFKVLISIMKRAR